DFACGLACSLRHSGSDEESCKHKNHKQIAQQLHHALHAIDTACANMAPKSSLTSGFQSLPLVASMVRVWSSSASVGTGFTTSLQDGGILPVTSTASSAGYSRSMKNSGS